MPKISVIIPMYNPGKSIYRCLKSVFKQSFTDYEIILLDDGSTDGSSDAVDVFVSKYLEKHDVSIKVIHKDNSGVADTRNYGISLANGDYISFIDQDDFIVADYLETYYEAATRSDADIVVGGYERVASTGRILRRELLKDTIWARYIVTAPWAHLYKRTFLIENDIEFLKSRIGEDVYFNIVAYQYTDKVETIKNVGYKWFFNEASVSNSVQNTLEKDIDVFPLLNAIYDKVHIEGENANNLSGAERDEYLEYFFSRYICWYLLFSTRGSKKSSISEMYDKIFEWLKERYPDYRKQKFIGLRMPKGENIKYHGFVWVFFLLEKMRLLKFVLKLFGTK